MFERLSATFDGTVERLQHDQHGEHRATTAATTKASSQSRLSSARSVGAYAFVGLERDSGIVVLDISQPAEPVYVTYATNRKLPRNPTLARFWRAMMPTTAVTSVLKV